MGVEFTSPEKRSFALTIRRHIPRLATAVLEAVRGAPTGFIADARGRKGGLSSRLRPITPGWFAGPALTIRSAPRDNLAVWAGLELCRPGDVLAIAIGGSEDCSVLGDLFAGVARNRGAAAIVTDGLVRDSAGLEEAGLPVFAAGLSPNSPEKRGPGEVGLPIDLGGARIEPGDLLLGDRDGVVHVPRAEIEAVLAALPGIREKEAKMDKAIRDGALSAPWLPEALERLGVRYLDGEAP